MKKIIINHLLGSKTNKTDFFELPIQEILFGRENHCQVIFDPEKDDLVSRVHCKISVQNENEFLLTDLNSTNGTYVNDQKINAPHVLKPGDVIQLGKGGVKFSFDLDPRPQVSPKATRYIDTSQTSSATREQRIEPSFTQTSAPTKEVKETAENPRGIGKTTLMREINYAENKTRKKMINYGAGIVGLIIVISGYFVYQSKQDKEELVQQNQTQQIENEQKIAQITANAPLDSSEIFKKYAGSTVLIEFSWKLIHTTTGKQIFQALTCRSQKNGKCTERVPAYKYLNGEISPELTEDSSGIPIGAAGSGSGFVVDKTGFILTNRHVAASWQTSFTNFDEGILFVCQDSKCENYQRQDFNKFHPLWASRNKWVPSEANKSLLGKSVEGRNDYLDVTFQNTGLRIPAHLVRVSDIADVALIKIDVIESLAPVELAVNDPVVPGEAITVMGYPGISPDVGVELSSQDPFNRKSQVRQIPQPTVTGGNIGKVLQGKAQFTSDAVENYYSEAGDAYQLTVNATGSGNSGGPVFNDKGRVIGIFTSESHRGSTSITFAVPIKHGLELMGINKLLK